MIGSPDLLAFTGAEGFGDEPEDCQDALVLPEELSVPRLPPAHPWLSSSRAQFHRDFILVAEFSEQVGPQPVRTIPDDPRVVGSFDLSHFSVRLMSVDYQASCPAPVPSASPGPRLNFSDDSRVILGDSAESAFAYVHHLTLYDLEARGMVRPFCMAYVSSDQRKLMEHFAELSARFTRASDSLKTGNRRAFASELRRKLRELEHKRFTLLREAELQGTTANEAAAEPDESADELAAVERSVQDHRELLRQVTSYPNRKLKQPDFLPYDPADDLADSYGSLTPSLSPSPSLSSTSSSRNFERRLKTLEELSDAYFLSLTMEQLTDTERCLRGDRSVLHTRRVATALSRQLAATNFLFELWNPEEAEPEEEEGRAAGARGGGGGGGNDRASCRVERRVERPSMESFYSCMEELPIKLEAGGDGGAVTPDPEVATEMAGSMSSGDSIEVLGTERSYRTQGGVTGNYMKEMSVGLMDGCVRRGGAEPGGRRVRVSATRRTNSEDSIDVLSITDSIFPEDLMAITEEEAEYRVLSITDSIFPEDLVAITEEEAEYRVLGNGFQEEDALAQEDELTKLIADLGEEEDELIQDQEESLNERTMGHEVLGEDESLNERTMGNEVLGEDESLNERTMGNEVLEEDESLNERTMGNEVLEDESLNERTMGNEVLGEATEDLVHREGSLKQRLVGNEVLGEDESLNERTMGNEVLGEDESLNERTMGQEVLGEAIEDLVDREGSLKQRLVGNEVQCEEELLQEERNQVDEDSGSEQTSLYAVEEAVESLTRWSRLVPDLQVALAPCVALSEVSHWAPPGPPLRLLSVDEASDSASFTSSSPCPPDALCPAPGLHDDQRVRRRRRRKAGTRALRFLQQYSFSQHAVYCLLSGRPLVVIGGDENHVRKLVTTLTLFLPAPGLHGNTALPCLTTPLQLTDLLTWRLIGIHRSPSTPSSSLLPSLCRYSRYLGLLDLDQKTLRCPSFSGSLVSRLADPLTAICRGNTYLLHLESGLTALANHALLLAFHPALRRPDGSDEAARRRDFLLARGVCSSEDDLRVMHFLTDLVRQRHAGRGPPVLSFSYSPVQLHRNTLAP